MDKKRKIKKKQQTNDQWGNEIPIKKRRAKQRLTSKVKYKHKWLEMEEEY